ncbi:hypothetical protein [Ferruginibacter sp. HRS2-29]|uniref:hypothetical protein n=1 Tax=Ferruginibacter sp. HRS2-29 TaxID=2487334 RepID=UPI0020CE4B9B|nr:hypothetical protein [Ferruginibacter sp. HRS2-29]MCP9750004.1 hypothetical protein [Ferruginibacter sp. HRS2-29]
MSIATPSYAFEVTNDGENKIFKYKKAKLGLRAYFAMLWPGFIASGFLAYQKVVNYPSTPMTQSERFFTGIFYMFVFTPFVPIVALIIVNLLRRPGEFALTKQGIQMDGTTYPYSDIRNLYIKSPYGGVSHSISSTQRGFVFLGGDKVQNIGMGTAAVIGGAASTVAGAATGLSSWSGRAVVESFKRKGYKICFLFGNSEKVLARQLDEKMAVQLLNKIDEMI